MVYKKQIESYYPTCEQERVDKRVIYHYLEDYPHNILTRDNEVAHLTSSGFIMNESLTRVLVIFHKVYQAWGWTGGHADGDEDLLAIAMKEAREETGLTHLRPLCDGIMSIDILPVWGHYKKSSYVAAHLHLNATYILIADEADCLVRNDEETEGVMWIDADAIGDYSSEPELVVVYNKLIEAARKYDPKKSANPIQKHIQTDEGMMKAIKDTTIPIAVHEAKSAYYKAKLIKEITFRTGEAITVGAKKIFNANKKP